MILRCKRFYVDFFLTSRCFFAHNLHCHVCILHLAHIFLENKTKYCLRISKLHTYSSTLVDLGNPRMGDV